MREAKIKVVIWGYGAMGSGMAKMILKKVGFEIVGICDSNPAIIGKALSTLVDFPLLQKDIIIKKQIEDVVSEGSCDVVLLATDSFTAKAYQKIIWLVEHKVNVISTAEEMAYPKAKNPDLANKINEIAIKNGVSVLGTGVNPGMMMDLLVVFLSGVCENLDAIKVTRINSLSPFGKTVMNEQGVGLTIDEFSSLDKENKIAGHVGFLESAMMITEAMGLEIKDFHQEASPIITEVKRTSRHGSAEAGNVCGVDMRAEVTTNKSLTLELHHPQQIEPHRGGIKTGDYITINGYPAINMAITPEVEGGIGTIAICVNMIPHVINASSGLKTMLDLPVPRAILGDVRKMISEVK